MDRDPTGNKDTMILKLRAALKMSKNLLMTSWQRLWGKLIELKLSKMTPLCNRTC